MTAPGVRLSTLLSGAGVRPLDAPGVDPLIEGVCLDSRRVRPGDLFFALAGLHTDGVRFVPQAVENGARGVVAGCPRPAGLDATVAWVRVEEPRRVAGPVSRECYGRPDEAVTLVGITGTNGKTTVAYLVESIAAAAGLAAGRIGTVGHAFGGVEREAPRTTPEAPDLFRLLAEMRDGAVALVAMEVSSHALELYRVEGARFTVAAFLNLSRDHLDFHKTEQRYFEAKARLFTMLGPRQNAVLPADDPRGDVLAGRTRARVLRFGRSPRADVRLRDERLGLDGSAAVLEIGGRPLEVRTPLAGRFNLDNVAAAAACAHASGLPDEAIAAGVAALRSVPGRMERIDRGQPFAAFVDYAHTPAALAGLLATLRELTPGRVIVVFGCGGERDRGKRPVMGRIAAEGADVVFLTSDNPRGEDPRRILREIEAGLPDDPGARTRQRTIADRAAAVEAAVAAAEPGDALVVAGKGHETTQTIGDRVARLDDRELVGAALERFGRR